MTGSRKGAETSTSCKAARSVVRSSEKRQSFTCASGSFSTSDMSSIGQGEPSLVLEEMLTTSGKTAAVFTSTGAGKGEESKHSRGNSP